MRLKKLFELAALTLLGAAVVLCGLSQNYLAEIENRTWDARARTVAHLVPPDTRIKIIGVDQASLAHWASMEEPIVWPWPRSMYEPVLSFLSRAKAQAVAFDVVFSEGGCFSVEDDQRFAQSVSTSTLPVVSAVVAEKRAPSAPEARTQEELLALLKNAKEATLPPYATQSIDQATTLRTPFIELLQASKSVGLVNAAADSDGIFRRYPLGFSWQGTHVPSMAVAIAEAAGIHSQTLSAESRSASGFLLRFQGPPGTYPTFSVTEIIESELRIREGKAPWVDPKEFAGASVLIGYTAPELMDLRPSSFGANFPGVEFHATALDNLMNGRTIRQVPLRFSIGVSLAVIGAAVAAVLLFSSVSAALISIAVCAVIYVVGAYVAAAYGWWLPLLWPLLGLITSSLCSLGLQYHQEGRAHRFIRNAFRHYISPAVMQKLLSDPRALSLGGERRELTLFFSDIAGFTGISERLAPEKLAALLTRFLSAMTEAIQAHGGTVDKFVGDAIVAFWNAPVTQPAHAHMAVQAALACQERLTLLNKEFERDFATTLQLRIGIHTGVVTVGNFGSEERFNYTVVGDAANLASRLEGANKVLGSDVLISEATWRGLPEELPTRCLGSLRVVGRKDPVIVYQPVPDLNPDLRMRFEQARVLFHDGKLWEAAKLFNALAGRDPVARAYVARIENEPEGSEPVWNLREK